MGVVSNNRFDRVLLSILYMFKPLFLHRRRTRAKTVQTNIKILAREIPKRIQRRCPCTGGEAGHLQVRRRPGSRLRCPLEGGNRCHNPDFLEFGLKTVFERFMGVRFCFICRLTKLKGSGGCLESHATIPLLDSNKCFLRGERGCLG